jgi:hypothetical protein
MCSLTYSNNTLAPRNTPQGAEGEELSDGSLDSSAMSERSDSQAQIYSFGTPQSHEQSSNKRGGRRKTEAARYAARAIKPMRMGMPALSDPPERSTCSRRIPDWGCSAVSRGNPH